MATQWFIQANGKIHGPTSAATLKRLACQGKIDPDTLLRRDRDDHWFHAEVVDGLFDFESESAPGAGAVEGAVDHNAMSSVGTPQKTSSRPFSESFMPESVDSEPQHTKSKVYSHSQAKAEPSQTESISFGTKSSSDSSNTWWLVGAIAAIAIVAVATLTIAAWRASARDVEAKRIAAAQQKHDAEQREREEETRRREAALERKRLAEVEQREYEKAEKTRRKQEEKELAEERRRRELERSKIKERLQKAKERQEKEERLREEAERRAEDARLAEIERKKREAQEARLAAMRKPPKAVLTDLKNFPEEYMESPYKVESVWLSGGFDRNAKHKVFTVTVSNDGTHISRGLYGSTLSFAVSEQFGRSLDVIYNDNTKVKCNLYFQITMIEKTPVAKIYRIESLNWLGEIRNVYEDK